MDPTLLGICSLNSAQIKAARFKIRSWAWQWYEYPLNRQHWHPAVRAFVVGEFQDVHTLAAQNACFQATRENLINLANHKNWTVPDGLSVFDLVVLHAKKQLKVGVARQLEIAHTRLTQVTSFDQQQVHALLEIDEAAQVQTKLGVHRSSLIGLKRP